MGSKPAVDTSAMTAGGLSTPEDTRPWRAATHIEAFELCPRRWAWRKLDRIKTEPSPAIQLGREVHKHLELWLRSGVRPPIEERAGAIAFSGLSFLPQPGEPGLELEQPFAITLGGHRFHGLKDWQRLGLDVPEVGDHKTTGDLDNAKTPEELRTNFQAALYAADAMHRTGKPVADLVWVYYRTAEKRKRKAEPRRLRIYREDITPVLQRGIAVADAMAEIERLGLKAADLPYNAAACEAFGGCEYTKNCGLLPLERLLGIMSDPKVNDWLERMKSRGVNPPAPSPQPPAAPPAVMPVAPSAPPAMPAPVLAAGPPGWALGPDGQWYETAKQAMQAVIAPPAPVALVGNFAAPAPAPTHEPPPPEAAAAKRTRAPKPDVAELLIKALEAALAALRGSAA